MKKIDNFENVKAANDNTRLIPGGYVAQILNVKDEADKEYLLVEYDIAEGEYKNYYEELFHSSNFWGGKMYRSYKEKAQGMFKAFTNTIEESNEGYKWNWDEKSLIGALIGIVLGEEEYVGNDGSVKTRLYIKNIKSVQDIRDGKFKVPEKKLLPVQEHKPSFEEITEDIPFA